VPTLHQPIEIKNPHMGESVGDFGLTMLGEVYMDLIVSG